MPITPFDILNNHRAQQTLYLVEQARAVLDVRRGFKTYKACRTACDASDNLPPS